VFQCDFCGRKVDRVRRVALEADYDRLSRRHAVRYACSECSERKSDERASERAASGGPASPGDAAPGPADEQASKADEAVDSPENPL
jgi:hypothetical protein